MEARLVSSLEKVGLGQEPVPLKDNVPLSVFLGETVSFQIAFRDKDAGRGCGVILCREVHKIKETGKGTGDLQSAETLGIRTRQVLPVMCRYSCNPESFDEDYLFYDARMAPDLLRDAEGESISVTDEWQSLWVDVCPGEELEPGLYRVTFRFTEDGEGTDKKSSVADGETGKESPVADRETVKESPVADREAGKESPMADREAGKESPAADEEAGKESPGADSEAGKETLVACSVEIRVIGQILPPLPILHTEWFHCDGIVDYYGMEAFSEEFWRIFRNFIRVYVKRGGNMIYTPIMTPPLDTEVGLERTTIQLVKVELTKEVYRFDFSNLGRYLDICLEEGISCFEISHLFTQWGATAAPKVVAWTDGEYKSIFGWGTPSDDPEYLRFLGELIPALKEYLAGRGLLERSYFHISDEPNLDSVQYQAAQGAVRHLLEGCTIIEAVSDYAYYEKGLVDIPVCATNHIKPFLEKHPSVLWSYYCCAQTVEVPNRFISMPSWRNRIYGILLYWLGIDGFLHWGFNFYNSILSRKKIDPYETVDADGGFPAGDPFMVYPGKDGIPEESIRLMVQDEAINDYRALYALESRIGREKVMALIREEAGMELSFRQYPKGDDFILRLREKVNRQLENLL